MRPKKTREHDSEDFNEIASVVKPQMAKLGLTVQEVAQRMQELGMHVSHVSVYYWLSDTRRPLPELAEALEVVLLLPKGAVTDAYTPRARTPTKRRVGVSEAAPVQSRRARRGLGKSA